MTLERRERLGPTDRLRTSRDYTIVKSEGTALRGRHCLVLSLDRAGEPTKIGFIASKKGVGNAVQRNRARRRLREIVRRRFPRIEASGHWLAFIAFRSCTTAPHLELVDDVERLLAQSGAWAPAASSAP